MKPNTNRWIPIIQVGLIGGIIAVLIALLGMITTFAVRDMISGIISLGETVLVLTYFATAYVAIVRTKAQGTGPVVSAAVVAGVIAAACMVILILIGKVVDIGSVFVNATGQMYSLLLFQRDLVLGLVMEFVIGAASGGLAALIFLLPSRFQRPVVWATVILLTLGTLQDWLLRSTSNLPGFFRDLANVLTRLLYDSRGIMPVSAVVLFVAIALAAYFSAGRGGTLRQRVDRLPPARRRAVRWGSIALLVLILIMAPIFMGIENAEIADNIGLFIMMGLGLNIVVGFAGLLDLGYVAFYAIGAYTVGILTTPELGHAPYITSWWVALPFGVAVAVLAGVLLGIPVLKMRGDYLAIVTLGFGEIIRLVAGSDMLKSVIGGAQGTRSIAKPDIGPIQFGIQNFNLPLLGQIQFQIQQEFYYLILAGCLLAIFIATRVKTSRLGRSWMALREDEDVAQAMGINLVATKLMAFGMGAFFGGLSGAIFGSKLGSIYPNSFSFIVSINVVALIIVGGMGNIWGVVVGAIALVGLPELLREFSDFRWLFYGAILVLMMLTRPEGLLPEARRRLELEEFKEEQQGGPVEPPGREPVVLKTAGQP